jgi:hypothetical protein
MVFERDEENSLSICCCVAEAECRDEASEDESAAEDCCNFWSSCTIVSESACTRAWAWVREDEASALIECAVSVALRLANDALAGAKLE